MSAVSRCRVETCHVIRDQQETGNGQMGQVYVTHVCQLNTDVFGKPIQYSKRYLQMYP